MNAAASPQPLTMRHARQLETVHRAVTEGLMTGAAYLSRFVGRPLTIEAPRLGLCAIEDLVSCTLGSAFDDALWSEAESVKTGIYLTISGDVEGHFVMLLDPDEARSLVLPMIKELNIPFAQQDEMILSALAEIGNITLCAVVNGLADATKLTIIPSCPVVFNDMAGAILELPMLDIAQFSDEALYIETRISMDNVAAKSAMALIPRPQGLEMLIQHLTKKTKKGVA